MHQRDGICLFEQVENSRTGLLCREFESSRVRGGLDLAVFIHMLTKALAWLYERAMILRVVNSPLREIPGLGR